MGAFSKHSRGRIRIMAVGVAMMLALLVPVCSNAQSQTVISLHIDGTLNPVAVDYVKDGLKQAYKTGATCLLIHLNTAGGSFKSIHTLTQLFSQSTVPVVVYFSPARSRISMGGFRVAKAASISARAPATVMVARAHDRYLTGNSDVRVMDDPAAYNLRFIELVAGNEQDLLRQLNGTSRLLSDGMHIIHTQKAVIRTLDMSFPQKVMNRLSDPTTVYVVLVVGLMGLLFELFSPGAVFPGITGGICLFLAFYAFQNLPVNYIGLAMIIVGVVFYLLELKVASYGILAICGTVAILLGSHLLFEARPEEIFLPLNWGVVIIVTVICGLFFLFLMYMGLKAQRLKPACGGDALIGTTAIALSLLDPKGQVQIQGEIWAAIAISSPIGKGEKVIIRKVEELTLYVERI